LRQDPRTRSILGYVQDRPQDAKANGTTAEEKPKPRTRPTTTRNSRQQKSKRFERANGDAAAAADTDLSPKALLTRLEQQSGQLGILRSKLDDARKALEQERQSFQADRDALAEERRNRERLEATLKREQAARSTSRAPPPRRWRRSTTCCAPNSRRWSTRSAGCSGGTASQNELSAAEEGRVARVVVALDAHLPDLSAAADVEGLAHRVEDVAGMAGGEHVGLQLGGREVVALGQVQVRAPGGDAVGERDPDPAVHVAAGVEVAVVYDQPALDPVRLDA
jgi:hypothetical protein